MGTEYKTLRELDVKPGDVVEFNGGVVRTISGWADGKCYATDLLFGGSSYLSGRDAWRIISRAPRDDTADDKPVLWGDMTPEEKGALLLAHHEKKEIECLSTKDEAGWIHTPYPAWQADLFYRIKPEPKVKVVTQDFAVDGALIWASIDPTHRITFTTIDGKPDVNSIKMEEL
jgi:hypothetical protein